MGINIGSNPIAGVYVGQQTGAPTPATGVYVGSTQVWPSVDVLPSKPTEVLPNSTTTFGTRDNFRALLVKYGLDYTTVRELPFNLDTSKVTNMGYMFRGCSSLVSAPEMDTSKVTNMNSMFRDCSSLVSAPEMDTSKVIDMGYMFQGCSSLVSAPEMDTSKVIDMKYMLDGCASLMDGNVRLIRPGGTKPSSRIYMIRGSGLTREPFFLPDGTPIN